MVEVGERAEELLGAAHLVADVDAALARALDLEHLDDGPVALLDGPHHALVDLQRVLARLLEEDRVRHRADVRLAVRGIESNVSMCGTRASREQTGAWRIDTHPSVRVDAGGFFGKLHFVTK